MNENGVRRPGWQTGLKSDEERTKSVFHSLTFNLKVLSGGQGSPVLESKAKQREGERFVSYS